MIAANTPPAMADVAAPPALAPPRNVIMSRLDAIGRLGDLVPRRGRDVNPLDTKEEAMIAANTPPAMADVAAPPAPDPAPPRNVIMSEPAADSASVADIDLVYLSLNLIFKIVDCGL
jgi:hypothetical protein